MRFGIKSYCSQAKVAEICPTALRLQVAFCLQLIFFCAEVKLWCRTLACWAIASQVWHPFETNQLLFYSDSKQQQSLLGTY